jgi:hypothetical protein
MVVRWIGGAGDQPNREPELRRHPLNHEGGLAPIRRVCSTHSTSVGNTRRVFDTLGMCSTHVPFAGHTRHMYWTHPSHVLDTPVTCVHHTRHVLDTPVASGARVQYTRRVLDTPVACARHTRHVSGTPSRPLNTRFVSTIGVLNTRVVSAGEPSRAARPNPRPVLPPPDPKP